MRTSMTKMLSLITVMGIVIGMGLLASCQSNNSADLVVYGMYTSFLTPCAHGILHNV